MSVDTNGKVTLPFMFGYYTNADEEASADAVVESVLESLNLDGLSKYKQFEKIYAWICENITYDYDGLAYEEGVEQATPQGQQVDPRVYQAHTAYKGLTQGTCVCQGYACILYRLALECGIDARIVSGNLINPSGGHAWNIAQMGEKYYLCDSTWDAGHPSYSYFLRGKIYFAGHDTTQWQTEGNTGREDIMTTYFSKIDDNDCEEPAECTHANRTKVEEKNPTCTADGNIEYWQCASCEAKFTAQTGGTELTGNAWKIAAHHTLTAHAASAESCTYAGNKAYWYCDVCHKYYKDGSANAEYEPNGWVVAAHHTLTAHAASAEGCTYAGNKAYWYCEACHKYYKDGSANAEYETNGWKIAAHHTLTAHTASAEGCTYAGNKAYWYCDVCHKYYKDGSANAEYEPDGWKLPAHHTLTSHAASAEGCTYAGNKAYWYCESCHKYYKDGSANAEYESDSWKLPAHHTLTHHASSAATCTASGNSEYWSCNACGLYFSDASGTSSIAEWITQGPLGHIYPLEHVSEQAVTTTSDGCIEHWKCTRCEMRFDASGNALTESQWKTHLNGGGGGGDAAPEEPAAEDTEGVSVETEGGVSKVSIDESKIKGIIDGCMTESVEINFSTGLKASTDGKIVLSLPSQLVAGTKDKDKGMKISSEVGTVEFNSAALKKVAKGTVTISIKQTVKKDRTNIDISMKSGKKAVTKFGTGKVSITAPLPTNVIPSEACVVYVSSTYVIDMGAKVSNGNVVFSTNHFSTYSIMNNSTAKPDLIKSIKKSTLGKIKATSTKKTVKLTWNNAKGNTPTNTLIYRSTKAKKGFKKIATLTNGSKTYTDKAKLKKGKKYYYKVCGSYAVDGTKYNLKKSPVVAVKHK